MEDHCFIFLKDEYPDWCEECGKMEQRIIEGDGMSAIHICGKMGEKISKEICKFEKLNNLCEETQETRTRDLNKKGILTKNELKYYDRIRKKRNAEVHNDKKIKNEMADAYHNHENLYKISTNFYKKYINPDFEIPKYKQPKYASSNNETIIEQHSKSHNIYNDNKKYNNTKTVNITNINHNPVYSQNNELKSYKTEAIGSSKDSKKENESMDKKILVIGIVAIIAITALCLSFFATTINSTTNLQDTSQIASSSNDNTEVKSSDESTKLTDSNDESEDRTLYYASKKTDSFHKPSCEWAQKIKDKNLITYKSRESAIADGKSPCGVCNP